MQRAPASSAPMRMYRTGLPVLASRWGSTSSVGAASAALLPAGFFCFSSSSGRAAFSRSASRNASSRCCCFSSSSRRASSSSCCASEGSSTPGILLGLLQSPHRPSSSWEEFPFSVPALFVPAASPALFPAPSPVGSRGGSAGGAGSGAGGDSGEGSAGCSNAGMSFGSTTPVSSQPSSAIAGTASTSSTHSTAAAKRIPFIVCPPFCQKSGALGAPLLEYLRGYYISQLCQKPCTSSQSSSRSIRRVILSAASSGRAV